MINRVVCLCFAFFVISLIAVITNGYTADAGAQKITAFIEGKPYAVTIQLNGFEPWPTLQKKTILGGDAAGGIIVTIIVEQEAAPLSPTQVRDKYLKPGGLNAGDGNGENADIDGMAISLEHQSMAAKPMIKANGYAVKDTLSFDIHISAPEDAQAKERILNIFKSFQVNESDEAREMIALMDSLKKAPYTEKNLDAVRKFSTKFPNNSWAQVALGDMYYHASPKKLMDARNTYLLALENQKCEPFTNPYLPWHCYKQIGMISGMNSEYEKSKSYLDKAYTFAAKLGDKDLLANSAYNLACWYAETKDTEKAITCLKESIKNNGAYKNDAKTDGSFNSIRNAPAFQEVVGN